MLIVVDKALNKIEINNVEELNIFWVRFTKEIYMNNSLIYCIHIDGLAYYSNYEQILIDQFEQIVEVKISTITHQKAIFNTVEEFNSYLPRLLANANELVQPLYGDDNEQIHNSISTMVTSIQWIGQASEFAQYLTKDIPELEKLHETFNQFVGHFMTSVDAMSNELEFNNFVAFGDIFIYELLPLLEQLEQDTKEVGELVEYKGYQQ
ncbi:hypothetical protein [Paenibacillus sp. 1001270B_150601_E10]|uniref:hypothetical protein n=1 Tax=Paenibacillus sp. 1001270B_150601_E10 TaxID=2787079 RepID=UPI00189F1BCD|nr:hypothetical protein [Paenibacillus sp. 1001270B_150601_E10]